VADAADADVDADADEGDAIRDPTRLSLDRVLVGEYTLWLRGL